MYFFIHEVDPGSAVFDGIGVLDGVLEGCTGFDILLLVVKRIANLHLQAARSIDILRLRGFPVRVCGFAPVPQSQMGLPEIHVVLGLATQAGKLAQGVDFSLVLFAQAQGLGIELQTGGGFQNELAVKPFLEHLHGRERHFLDQIQPGQIEQVRFFGDGAGFWLNPRNGSGKTEFRIGDPAGQCIEWDGDDLHIDGPVITGGVITGAALVITSSLGLRYSTDAGIYTITGGTANGVQHGAQIDLAGCSVGAGISGAMVLQAGSASDGHIFLRTGYGGTAGSADYGINRMIIDHDGDTTISGSLGKISNDGKSIKLFTGDNDIELHWDGAKLQITIDGSPVGGVTPS